MSTAQIGDVAISYDDGGEGEALVLIHGHPFNRSLWRPQVEHLSRLGWRAIAPDLRGYGDSGPTPGAYPFSAFALDLAGLLDALAVDRAVLCGVSMGGQIALEFWRLFPERVRGLVLADTSARADDGAARDVRHRLADRLLAEGMAGYAHEVLPAMVALQHAAPEATAGEQVLAMMLATSPEGAAAALRSRAERPDYVAMLPSIDAPALVVVGRDDEFTPLAEAELLHERIPGATLRVVERAGHLPNLEQPEAFNAALQQFLESSFRAPAPMVDHQSSESALIHAGARRERGFPATPPLVPTSILVSWGEPDPSRDYGRQGNPSWEALEEALGGLEEAHACVFASGMAASMALMLALAPGRQRILLPRDGYYNTRKLAARLRPHGAEAVSVDLLDLAEVEQELAVAPSVLWAETPTNPLLRVADLSRLGELAAAAGAPMAVDNTVATGLLQRPLDLGATASVCSLTKSASGHSDVILGAVTTRDKTLAAEVRQWRSLGGAIPGPFESWLALRGLKTLPLRIARQSENALAVARHLAAHPRVRAVHYPGVEPSTLAVARRQMPSGFGPLLSFEIDGAAADADAVVEASQIILPATSFGGVESTWERRARWSSETAPETLIRFSAGIEPPADLIADIEAALTA